MTGICPKCGALLLQDARNCSFCNVPGVQVGADSALSDDTPQSSAEPAWRREVSQRLEQYRASRGRPSGTDSLAGQTGLPFRQALRETEGRPRPAVRQRQASAKTEHVEIRVQPELDFSGFPDNRAHPQTALVPVASLGQRGWAGALDALFLGLTCAGFLELFRSLGGEIAFTKAEAIVCLLVVYLFYAVLFSLFTTLAGATPGMQLCGLTVVRLDGSLPDTRQLLWRSFGYLLSGAALMLGFLWALWDEDRFAWQDRISKTYVTAAAPLSAADSLDIARGRPISLRH